MEGREMSNSIENWCWKTFYVKTSAVSTQFKLLTFPTNRRHQFQNNIEQTLNNGPTFGIEGNYWWKDIERKALDDGTISSKA